MFQTLRSTQSRFRTLLMAVTLAALCAPVALAEDPPAKAVSLPGTANVALRVRARNGAKIYAMPKNDAEVVRGDVKFLDEFYVYGSQEVIATVTDLSELGWYKVGDAEGKVIGWIKAYDVIPWKHQIVIAFPMQKETGKLLMFGDVKDARELATWPAEKRSAKASDIYKAIGAEKPHLPEGSSLRAVGPQPGLDQGNALLHVITIADQARISIDGKPALIMKLACATQPADKTAAPIVTDKPVVPVVPVPEKPVEPVKPDAEKKPDPEKKPATPAPEKKPSLLDDDDVVPPKPAPPKPDAEKKPAPEKKPSLLDDDDVVPKAAAALPADSCDPAKEEKKPSLLDDEDLVPPTPKPPVVDEKKKDSLLDDEPVVPKVDPPVVPKVDPPVVPKIPDTPVAPGTPAFSPPRSLITQWVGGEIDAAAPADFTAWALDRDPLDPNLMAVEPRVFLKRSQLEAIAGAIKKHIAATKDATIAKEATTTPIRCFQLLRATSILALSNPALIGNAEGDNRRLAEILSTLPYRSRAAEMTVGDWGKLDEAAQAALLVDAAAKAAAMDALLADAKAWTSLHKDSSDADKVILLKLTDLP